MATYPKTVVSGVFNHRIEFVSPSGQSLTSFSARVWWRPALSRVVEVEGEVYSQEVDEVVVRYNPQTAQLTNQWRILDLESGNRNMDIQRIFQPHGPRTYYVLRISAVS